MAGPALLPRLLPQDSAQRWYVVFVLLLLLAGTGALLSGSPLWLAVPVAVVGALVLAVDWRWVYYLLLITLAFSREVHLPGGLSMDVPSEPLMLVLLGCFAVSALTSRTHVAARFWSHPLVIIMGLALLWSSVSTLFSVDSMKSVKYLLAKTWYIIPFVFVTLAIVRRPADVWRIAAFYTVGAALTVLYTSARHAGRGFSFDSINWAIQPYYINHVIYAAVLALLVPYAFYAALESPSGPRRLAWRIGLAVLVFGVLLSYTRASILSLPLAALFYGVVRLRLTRVVLTGAIIAVLSGAFYFMSQNNYMLYAPDFEKTVFNGHNFEKHLEATYKMEDVSGMERVYRWVAAARMISDKPLTGSGPSTFYPEYKRYTVKSFRTYVSDNPEHSTTHNYFLLQMAEQGAPGLILFVLLVATALVLVERLYHRARTRQHRRLVLAAGLSLVIITFHLLLNELVEVDKIGSFFYIALALLMRVEGWIEEEAASPELPAASQEREA
ncbi:O-antigen ligase family protein [Hymenobacter sp. BT175]|uniref:O-antigen ligase family protein n=1 Tax=Hymenobacter translucens TaxID=2886507 RepID=UPI001D0E8D39|nr:O-antigen ligase family protein [Hymenobacter translucens]MCC2545375.1 O-antigen ligase family protein [Hymenobacter translucens]